MIRFRLKKIVATVLDTGLPHVVREDDKPVAVVLPYSWWQQDHEERGRLFEATQDACSWMRHQLEAGEVRDAAAAECFLAAFDRSTPSTRPPYHLPHVRWSPEHDF